MGLDISAYSKMARVQDEVAATMNEDQIFEMDCVIITDGHKKDSRIDDMQSGFYTPDEGSECHDFRAGSYSGYNDYRNKLAECFLNASDRVVWANPDLFEGKPFYEQVDFSDCEGYMGPLVSAKLHQDYVNGREQWVKWLNESGQSEDNVEWYLTRYDHWTKAFGLAADGGILRFC